MGNVEKYKDLQDKINKLVFKNKKNPSDFEKMDRLYSQQADLEKYNEVLEYINSFANKK